MINLGVIVVFDMGATHTRVAVSTDGITIGEPIIFETNPEFGPGVKLLTSSIQQISNGKPIKQISGGIAGVLNREHSTLEKSSNLPNWVSKPIRTSLMQQFAAPVNLFNDSEMVGLGEAVAGAGKNSPIVAYVTISTGIGGVRIVEQAVDRSAFGSEIGYHYMASDHNDQPISFEQAAGGNALLERYGKSPRELAQDSVKWNKIMHYVAVGVHNVILFWSPDVIVLGGGMMHDIPLDRLRREVGELLTVFAPPPELRLAELGDTGGLLGALRMANQPNKA